MCGRKIHVFSLSVLTRFCVSFQFRPGVPIEVVPFAYAKVLQNLHHILGSPKATLRMAVAKGMNPTIFGVGRNANLPFVAGPVVSDNGNFIIDAPFEREKMINPYTVSFCLSFVRYPHKQTEPALFQIMAQIKMLTGVVEVGLFCHMAKAAYFGNEVRWSLCLSFCSTADFNQTNRMEVLPSNGKMVESNTSQQLERYSSTAINSYLLRGCSYGCSSFHIFPFNRHKLVSPACLSSNARTSSQSLL